MAVKTIKPKSVEMPLNIKLQRRKDADQHKDGQKRPVHDVGSPGLGDKVETVIREAGLHTETGGQ